MNTFYDALNRVLKYSGRDRLPYSAIHPELRFTRLGALLRETAAEPSDVGELAYQAITSDHSQPLELMPLHLLRDKMQENPEHPLNNLKPHLHWETLPERVHLDQTLRRAVDDWNASPESGIGTVNYGNGMVGLHHLHSSRPQPRLRSAGSQKVLDKVHGDHNVSVNDVSDSIRRLTHQNSMSWFAESPEIPPEDRTDPELVHERILNSTAIGHPAETYR